MTPPFKLGRRHRPTQKEVEDRGVRQSENYYEKMGYSPEAVEREAEMDFQIAQRLKGRKRGLRNIKLTGVEN